MASQDGISTVQSNNGLTGWAKQGSGKTNFKSSISLVNSEGKNITANQLNPMPVWDAIPPNCKLKYRAETISKGEGKSDRCQLDIQYTDYQAIFRVLDRVKANLTEEQLERYEAGSKVMEDSVNKMVAQIFIDEQIPITKTIFSKTFNTDENGVIEGEIDISGWPLSVYNIMWQYGYRGDEESRTNWGNAWANIGTVAAVVGFTALSFIPGIGWAAQAAILAAEIAVFTAVEMMKTYGMASENKYGVTFPQYGFLHPYAFGMYGEEVAQSSQGIMGGLTNGTMNTNDLIKIGGGILLTILILRRLL